MSHLEIEITQRAELLLSTEPRFASLGGGVSAISAVTTQRVSVATHPPFPLTRSVHLVHHISCNREKRNVSVAPVHPLIMMMHLLYISDRHTSVRLAIEAGVYLCDEKYSLVGTAIRPVKMHAGTPT